MTTMNLTDTDLRLRESVMRQLDWDPEVEDSGVGIPEEKREAMFEPFVRGTENRGEGLGLGLSLVQRICENQGWSVSLTTREPSGCRFQVELCRMSD